MIILYHANIVLSLTFKYPNINIWPWTSLDLKRHPLCFKVWRI